MVVLNQSLLYFFDDPGEFFVVLKLSLNPITHIRDRLLELLEAPLHSLVAIVPRCQLFYDLGLAALAFEALVLAGKLVLPQILPRPNKLTVWRPIALLPALSRAPDSKVLQEILGCGRKLLSALIAEENAYFELATARHH